MKINSLLLFALCSRCVFSSRFTVPPPPGADTVRLHIKGLHIKDKVISSSDDLFLKYCCIKKKNLLYTTNTICFYPSLHSSRFMGIIRMSLQHSFSDLSFKLYLCFHYLPHNNPQIKINHMKVFPT